jgi:hypothetical protein
VTTSTWTWVFARNEERLTLQRLQTDASHCLVIEDRENGSRYYDFSDIAHLIRFQSDMEAFLLGAGWTLAEFHPERRSSPERRQTPRSTPDRRRWWTGGRLLDFVHGGGKLDSQ